MIAREAKEGAREKPQLVKCPPHKHEDMSLGPSTHIKFWHICKPSFEETKGKKSLGPTGMPV